MTCHCPAHGGKLRPGVAPNPFPGSTLLDRYHDWQDAMDDLTCTRECGAARNSICRCRCRGLHHNAAHDYLATLPRETWVEYLPGGSTIRHVNQIRWDILDRHREQASDYEV